MDRSQLFLQKRGFILWEVRKNPVRTRNNEISISRSPHMNLFQNERNITKAS